MTVKAGQKCTAIRRAFVPSAQVDAVVEAVTARLAKVTIGNPAHPEVPVEPGLAEVLKGAKIFPIDDAYAGANRKRIVERWVKEIANP